MENNVFGEAILRQNNLLLATTSQYILSLFSLYWQELMEDQIHPPVSAL